MRFTGFIFKNLMRRKFLASLTTLGVAIAIAAVVSLLGMSSGLRRTAAERFESMGVDLMVLRAGVAQRLNSSLNEGIGDRLAKLPHVKGVASSLSDMVSLDSTSMIGIPVHGWPPDSFGFENLHVTTGRQLAAGDSRKVALGKSLAGSVGKKTGSTMEIEGESFEIVGVFESTNVFDNGSAIVPLKDLQELMDRPGQVTEFQIALEPNLPDRKAAVEKLRTQIDDLRDDQGKRLGLAAMPTEEFINKNTEIKLTGGMAWITSAIALIIGSVGMLNTMVMSVLERTQEIGILRAIGWRKGRIIGMVLSEAFVLSLVGAVVGTIIAIALTRFLSTFSDAQTYVRGDTSPSIIAAGFLLAGVVAVIGGAYPAYRGASLPPTEALRYE